jgi:hypothetical protein
VPNECNVGTGIGAIAAAMLTRPLCETDTRCETALWFHLWPSRRAELFYLWVLALGGQLTTYFRYYLEILIRDFPSNLLAGLYWSH